MDHKLGSMIHASFILVVGGPLGCCVNMVSFKASEKRRWAQ